MATHEFVVPRSMPITSPASAPDVFHRIAAPAAGWANLEASAGEAIRVVALDPKDEIGEDPASILLQVLRFMAVRPLRRLICSAMV